MNSPRRWSTVTDVKPRRETRTFSDVSGSTWLVLRLSSGYIFQNTTNAFKIFGLSNLEKNEGKNGRKRHTHHLNMFQILGITASSQKDDILMQFWRGTKAQIWSGHLSFFADRVTPDTFFATPHHRTTDAAASSGYNSYTWVATSTELLPYFLVILKIISLSSAHRHPFSSAGIFCEFICFQKK